MPRICQIVDGSVGTDEDADGDGAYSLFDLTGTPEEIGKAIAESLKSLDIYQGGDLLLADRKRELFLKLVIKFSEVQS